MFLLVPVREESISPKDALILAPEMFKAIKQQKEEMETQGKVVTDNDILRLCYVNFVKKNDCLFWKRSSQSSWG